MQVASYRRVTAYLPVRHEIIAEENDGPAFFKRAEVVETGDEERLDLLGNASAFG